MDKISEIVTLPPNSDLLKAKPARILAQLLVKPGGQLRSCQEIIAALFAFKGDPDGRLYFDKRAIPQRAPLVTNLATQALLASPQTLKQPMTFTLDVIKGPDGWFYRMVAR